MNECLGCDCYDEDLGCKMPSIDKWYACSLYTDKDELKEIFKVGEYHCSDFEPKVGE